MPYGFRVRRKRTTLRRRRINRRRIMRVSRPLRMPSMVMKFKRKFWLYNWTLNTATTIGFWRYLNLTLNDMPASTEITNLFDQFKISGIRYELHPRYDTFGGENTTDTTLPGVTNQAGNKVHVVNDPRSALTPTGTYTTATLNSFMEQGKVRTYSGNRTIVIYHKPTIVQSLPTGSRVIKAPWLQTSNSTTVSHFGAHVFLQDINLTGVTGQSYDVFATLYMVCRGAR